jgi:ElaB/YqjD/DUF883 family membrane-anchored ribosome-binding protein
MSAKDKASTTTSDSPTGGSDKDARTSEEIRSDIDQTREELGETVAAVADKADLKKQAQQFAQANPAPLAIGGAFIAGFVLGRILSR